MIVSDLGKGSFATVYRGYHEVRRGIRSITGHPPHPLMAHTANTPSSRNQDCKQEWTQPKAL